MEAILRRASRIIVMTEKGRTLLEQVHGVNPSRVAVIPHGIPDRPLTDPEEYKARFGFAGRKVLLTFGLPSPNKGIETVIEALPAVVERHPDVLYVIRSEEHTSELQSLMRISYAVFCLKQTNYISLREIIHEVHDYS